MGNAGAHTPDAGAAKVQTSRPRATPTSGSIHFTGSFFTALNTTFRNAASVLNVERDSGA